MKFILKIAVALGLSALALVGASAPAPAADSGKKVILIVMNTVGLDEILAAPTPNIQRLMSAGATGLMNARAAGGNDTGNFYVSIGAGARTTSGPKGALGFNALERLPDTLYGGLLTAKDIVRQNNRYAVPNSSVVNLSINDAAARNVKYHNNVVPGLLGEALGAGGKKTAVFGNADLLGSNHREITLITMNMRGVTGSGDVSGDLTMVDKKFPGGLRTDYQELAAKVGEAASRADFIAVELGDTARIADQRYLMKQSVNTAVRNKAIVAADDFIGVLNKRFAPAKTLMILVVPEPEPTALLDRDYLTPIFVAGLGKGALTSDTTKKSGIVANMDIAPTILDYLDVPTPVEMAGGAITSSEMSDVANRLMLRHDQIVAMRTVRSPVLLVYSLLVFGGLAAAAAVVRLRTIKQPVREGYLWALKIFLLSLLAAPAASLTQIPVEPGNLPAAIGSLLAGALILALVALSFSRKNPLMSLLHKQTNARHCEAKTTQPKQSPQLQGLPRSLRSLAMTFVQQALMPFIIVGGATTLILAYDALTGTLLSERSFFGSDLISGGRFYGLGNTYMGVMLGASVLALAAVGSQKFLKNSRLMPLIGSASMLAVAVIIGHPRIGANVGGLISGVTTALFFWAVLRGVRFSWKTVAAGTALTILLTALIMSFDLPKESGQSHAGKGIAVIQAKGSQAVGDIIIRKVRMNIRGIFSYTGVLILLLAGLIVILRWSLASSSFLGSVGPGFEVLIKGFKAMIWAAIIAGVFNDTGAIAAAMILLFLVVPLYLLALDPADIVRRPQSEYPDRQDLKNG